MKINIIFIVLLSILIVSCNRNGRIDDISENIESTLKAKPDYSEEIESNLADDPKRVDSRKLLSASALQSFYEERNYDQAWTSGKGLNSHGENLWELINEAPEYGLNPDWYHVNEITEALNQKNLKAEALANIDILLTDSYMLLASHFAYGALDKEKNNFVWKWEMMGRKGELPNILQQAWENNNIKSSLLDMQPQWFEYTNLQQGLAKFWDTHDINDKKHSIPDIKQDSVATYESISKILVELKLLDQNNSNNYEEITESLKEFQKWHGIPVDGIIGDYTIEALSMSTGERYNQIAINLDRMRWDLVIPDKYVLVNIPAYHLKFVKDNEPKEIFDVIVGTTENQTPELIDNMTYIETFPYWHVPASIVNEEILPKLQNDPSKMSALGYRVLDDNNNEIDPSSLSWSDISTEKFNYSIRQDGDSSNSLGLIKFMFPNKQNIYIHDTPSRHLFVKEMRSFSHGCIRINDPLKFAEIILTTDNNKYKAEQVREMIENKQNRQLKLNEPIPVIIKYYTAEADNDGNVFIYKDIYERDKSLLSLYAKDYKKLVSLK